MRGSSAWIGLFFSLFLAFLAFGAEAAEPDEVDLAQQYFDEGAELYLKGDYAPAIVAFMKGNDAVPNALFLYNISLCYMKIGNVDETVLNATRAERMGGLDAKTSAQNSARILALGARRSAESIQPILAAVPAEREFGTAGVVGVVTLVAGGSLLIIGGVVAYSIGSIWDDYEKAAERGDEFLYGQFKEDIEERQTLGLVLLGSGALLTVVGAIMVAIELTEDDETALFITTDGETSQVGFSGAF